MKPGDGERRKGRREGGTHCKESRRDKDKKDKIIMGRRKMTNEGDGR